MRRTLFLVSAAAAALGSTLAATSSNIVGYVKLNLAPGFSLIANQLDNGSGNKVIDLFKSLPVESTVYKWNGNGYDSNTWFGDVDGWENPASTMTAAPGEGVFVRNVAATAAAITFVGEVKTGTSTVNIPANGFSVVSSVIPQQLTLDTASGFPAVLDDTVYLFTGAGYIANTYFGEVDGWESGAAPVVAVGQAFFVKKTTAGAWTRNFIVN